MANNLSGISYTNNFSNLDGLSIVQADEIFIDGVPINTDSFIPYNGATSNVNLGTFNFQTLGQVTAKKLALAAFDSTMMTSLTASSIFTADSWGISNTVEISSLGSGSFLSTSYLTISDTTNNSTLLTFQSDGIANFANTRVRLSTMASNAYDVVNLTTLQASVAFIENVNALNYVPYNGATDNLNMGGSTITTTGLMSAGAVRITSSISNADYTLSVNTFDQLEFTNLSNGSIFKTNGSDLFVSGNVNCATLGATNVEAGTNIYLAKGSTAEWRTTLGMSDEYEIQDNAGVMRLRLSKTAGLTISTMTITQVPSATPTLALGVNGGGSVVSFAVPTTSGLVPYTGATTTVNLGSQNIFANTARFTNIVSATPTLALGVDGSGNLNTFAVPTATNILPLDNTFTGSNLFNSTLSTSQFSNVSLGGITTINTVSFTTGQLQTPGISSQAVAPGVMTYGATQILTPSPTTSPFASCYSISQSFPTTNARYEFLFTGFVAPIFGVSLTVYRANVANSARIAISATVPVVVGTFVLGITPNSNPSFLGQVFLEFSGTANKTVGWTNFTYRQGTETIAGNFNVSGETTTASITINNGSGGALTKLGSTTGYYASLAGGNATNSPFLEFYAGGSRRFVMGDATTTEMKFQSENGASLNFYTGGTSRMTIATAGIITMGATATQTTIGADGVIKWSNPNGSQTHWGYPSGGGSDNYIRGTNTIIDTPVQMTNVPENSAGYARVMCMDGNNLRKGQCMQKRLYQNGAVSWGAGTNFSSAFYKWNQTSVVRISGKYSGYWTSGGLAYVFVRIYSQSTGGQWGLYLPTYTNNTYNHVTLPLDLVYDGAELPATGWFDLYIVNSSGLATDGNDQLTINISVLPANSF